jgi:predicted HicB family RNase H-like nuclease
MPARKDKTYEKTKSMSMRIPVRLIDVLTRVADAKHISRNALIATLLAKATKRYAKSDEVQG